jgi:hypothetical protein
MGEEARELEWNLVNKGEDEHFKCNGDPAYRCRHEKEVINSCFLCFVLFVLRQSLVM